MIETHSVPVLSACSKTNGNVIEHTYINAYKFDGFVPATNKPRWLLLKVCTVCKGCYAYALTDRNPRKVL